MNKDVQKPILYKADADLFVAIENMKDSDKRIPNRNRLINEAVRLYLELIKLLQQPDYAYLNEISFNDIHLQTILYNRLKAIGREYPPHRYRK